MPLTWPRLVALGRELPEVTLERWFRTPALKVRGKGFVRLEEDGKTVVFVVDSVGEQKALVRTHPEVYFITDHYRSDAVVLAWLPRLHVREARVRLERAWRAEAPAAAVKAFDGPGGETPVSTARRRRGN